MPELLLGLCLVAVVACAVAFVREFVRVDEDFPNDGGYWPTDMSDDGDDDDAGNP